MKYLFDADGYVYIIAYLSNNTEDYNIIERTTHNYIQRILFETIDKSDYNKDDYLLLFTSRNNFRYDITNDYKANRKEQKKYKWLRDIYSIIKENYNTLTIKGYEADDLAASIMKDEKDKWILVHKDKDLLQIPGYHLYRNKKIYINEEEAYKILLFQLMVGDNVDNIKGIEGIGKVKAKKIIKECENIYELLFKIMGMYIDAYKDTNKGLEEFYKTYKLIKLNDKIKWKKEVKK